MTATSKHTYILFAAVSEQTALVGREEQMSNASDTMQNLINQIYRLVTVKPEQGDAVNSPVSTMVQLCNPGIPINIIFSL